MLFVVASALTTPNAVGLPTWLAWPLGALCLLGIVGLVYSVGDLIRVNNPTENAYKLPASQAAFRFTLTQPGRYELACTRAGRWGNGFLVPDVALRLRQLATGTAQTVRTSNWHPVQRTSMSGETTLTMATFTITVAGEYELLNPATSQFKPGDQLRILPATGGQNVLLILAVVLSSVAMLGGFIAGLIAALGSGRG
jgi:plastocyanin